MNQRHLSDDRLIELSLTGVAAPAEEPHLAACGECEGRRAALMDMLDGIAQTATLEADAAFPAERLARQHARILHRIEQEGRPARVIAFPAGHPQAPVMMRSRPASRWVAGAAAAGLVIGLLAGHLAHELPGGRRVVAPQQIVSNESGSARALRPVSTTLSDDEFLGQIEVAVDSGGPAALRPLDALTPRAWDVAAR